MSAPAEGPGAGFVAEALSPDFGFYLRTARVLAERRTPLQHIEVLDTPLFGRAMRIDGCFMTSERDEFFYHEPMVQLPAVSHGNVRSALVIGGGDGGSARELLRHRQMARVLMVELDGDVPAMAREWLPRVSAGAFDDPRLELRIGDGHAYMFQADGERFDQIVLDLTDPFGPAVQLYTAEFYAACRERLNPGGVLSLHIQSPIHRSETLARIVASVRTAFAHVAPYFQYVPLYGTLWAMALASDRVEPTLLSPVEIDRRIAALGLRELKLYNGAMHQALLAQPNFVRELLARPAEPIRAASALQDPTLDPEACAAPRVLAA
ncbi:polyamine aminopropyltransferase [Ottowia sp. GY511]|uniref:Polyamine aminopropyltransferase n=1 Tax=Ottowia flava TaxID=2675430 RepID=A0ABW4L1V8_9BURK|nr:polyamine aminopropyltransferase [Ottowia sp. GY511]TXK27339.1 polyamine aminopropyltransferase [Ottowia sp. GY511]